MNTNLSAYKFNVIAHALGVPVHNIIFNNTKEFRVLPYEFPRNYYPHQGNYLLDEMESYRLVVKREAFGNTYYNVTRLGANQFIEDFGKLFPYFNVKNRNSREYIFSKINTYCFLADYKFGENNAVAILDYYKKWVQSNKVRKNRDYLSSTTKEVVYTFEKELKKLVKLEQLAN